MKFSSALISASLLATVAFAAPESQASMASVSQVSAASAPQASEYASVIASVLEAADASASMDITNLMYKEGGAKRYGDDDDDDNERHHKKDDDKVVFIGDEYRQNVGKCFGLTYSDLISYFSGLGITYPIPASTGAQPNTTERARNYLVALLLKLVESCSGSSP